MKDLKSLASRLTSFCQKELGFKNPPKLFLKQDLENSNDPLGKTAYYDPGNRSVTLFVSGRHIKDILRSLSHELVHHHQNLRGDLSSEKCGKMTATYAQDNGHMRNMEKEAYLLGNIIFRDWEDSCKYKNLSEYKILKENKKMSTKKKVKISKEKVKELIKNLIEKKLKETSSMANGNVEGAANDTFKRKEDLEERHEEDEEFTHGRFDDPNRPGNEELSSEYGISAKQGTLDSVSDLVDGGAITLEELEQLVAKMKSVSMSSPTIGLSEDSNEDDSDDEECDVCPDEDDDDDVDDGYSGPNEILTPEQESSLFERRFGARNQNLFEKLTKNWTK